MRRKKHIKDVYLFYQQRNLIKLTALGDPLDEIAQKINFELFRPYLIEKIQEFKHTNACFDVVMLFKILLLQRIYNLSDKQIEFQINDRLSFMRFLGISIINRSPDVKILWAFRKFLYDSEAFEFLSNLFYIELRKKNIAIREGIIVDVNIFATSKNIDNAESQPTNITDKASNENSSKHNNLSIGQEDTAILENNLPKIKKKYMRQRQNHIIVWNVFS